MRFEIVGVESATGEERTLVTDVADEQEARDRAAAYGINITSLRLAGDSANAAANIASEAVASGEAFPPRASSGTSNVHRGKGIASFICAMLVLGAGSIKIFRGCHNSDQPDHQMSPAQLQHLQEQMKPKLPAWAEEARRDSELSLAELAKVRAKRAKLEPGAPPRGANEEWVKDANGQWKQVR